MWKGRSFAYCFAFFDSRSRLFWDDFVRLHQLLHDLKSVFNILDGLGAQKGQLSVLKHRHLLYRLLQAEDHSWIVVWLNGLTMLAKHPQVDAESFIKQKVPRAPVAKMFVTAVLRTDIFQFLRARETSFATILATFSMVSILIAPITTALPELKRRTSALGLVFRKISAFICCGLYLVFQMFLARKVRSNGAPLSTKVPLTLRMVTWELSMSSVEGSSSNSSSWKDIGKAGRIIIALAIKSQ